VLGPADNLILGWRLRRSYAKRQEFNAITQASRGGMLRAAPFFVSPPRLNRRANYPRLLGRGDADRDQRSVGRTGVGTAGRPFFAEELRRVAGRPAIGRDQDFVVLALHRTTREAIRFNDPNGRAWRTLLALRASRTGRTRRARGTNRTLIAFGALRSRRTCIPLRTLAATRQSRQQRHCECQMRCTHF
jgi:hypothetical protein